MASAGGDVLKKTAKRTTPEQLHYFVEFCRAHPEMGAGKNSSKVQELWQQCADGLNCRRGPKHTAKKWKNSLSGWKKQLRCRVRKQKAAQLATGGGPPIADAMSEFEQFALETLGSAAAVLGFEETANANNASAEQNEERPAIMDSQGGSSDDAVASLDTSTTHGITISSDASSDAPSDAVVSSESSQEDTVGSYAKARDSMIEFLKKSIDQREEAAAKREEAAAKREEATAKREEAMTAALIQMAAAVMKLKDIIAGNKTN